MHPYLFHFGHLYLPTFGVLAAVGLLAALLLGERTAGPAGVEPDVLWDAGLFAILAAFVSSRALLVAAHWQSFRAYPVLLLTVPSLTAGGLLLTVIATLVWLRWRGVPALRAMDAWAPCGTLLWMFLSLGHFFEGSDPGMSTGLPWGVRMPGLSAAEHPVGLYAALLGGVLTAGLWRVLRLGRPGLAAGLGLVGVGLGQFLLTFVRVPGVALGPLDALEWVGLGMLVLGGLLVSWVLGGDAG